MKLDNPRPTSGHLEFKILKIRFCFVEDASIENSQIDFWTPPTQTRDRKTARKEFQEHLLYGLVNEGEGEF